MASFADQNSSFVSGRSSRSGTRKPKTKRLEPYISPFVLEANKRAQQRVRERMSRARPPRIPSPPPVFQHDSGEWNNSVQSAGLFDPALRKQEIFRLEPRNRRNNNANQRPQSQNFSNSGVRSDSTTTTTSNNMTVRTNRDSPVRNINRAPYRNSERSQSPNEVRYMLCFESLFLNTFTHRTLGSSIPATRSMDRSHRIMTLHHRRDLQDLHLQSTSVS